MILTPKNWTSFQHYKDRNPPWIKLHKSLLDNWEYQCLPDASKALAPMLWLLASEHPDGVIEMSEDALMFRLRKTLPELITAIQPLVSNGFFTCDSDLLAPCKQNAVPEKRREEAYKPEEKEERPPSAPSVPLLKVKKEKPPKKIKTTALKPLPVL
jgi:hypothetical protein